MMMVVVVILQDTITLQAIACDSYTWLGTTYTNSGIYDSLFTNNSGCDSLVILDLIINYTDTNYINTIACDSFTLNGTTYTHS